METHISEEELMAAALGKRSGSKRNRKVLKGYVTNWKPIHTKMVQMHLQGIAAEDIAEETGYNKVSVLNILRTPQARDIIDGIQARVLAHGNQTLPEKLNAIQQRSIEVIGRFLNNEKNEASNPFAFFDRAVKAASLAHELQAPAKNSEASTSIQNNQFNLLVGSPKEAKEITDGLHKALEVSNQHMDVLPESVGSVKSLEE